MNYAEEVKKLEPTAKVSFHCVGSAEWVSVKRAPYTDKAEIAYRIDGTEEDGWKAAYNTLTQSNVAIPVRTGPGGYDYPVRFLL